MNRPDWWGLDRDELDEFVRQVAAKHKLNERESRHLHGQLSFLLGHWPNQLRKASDVAYAEAILRDTKQVILKVGSGLTARTFVREVHIGEAQRFYRKERRTINNGKRYMMKHPFKGLAKSLRHRIDDALWASGCLQIAYHEWIIPNESRKPHEGVWWYCCEIERHLSNAENQIRSKEPEFAARNAFIAGQLFAELEIRLAHNDYFEKQRSITDAQRSAPKARRLHSDEVRREKVRYYMLLGDKPTIAAENAARDLGVSKSTIRRAFPDGLLPEDPNNF